MQTILLSVTDRDAYKATHKVIIKAADVAALGSGTTGTLAIYPESGTFPAGTGFAFVSAHLVTAFDASDASVNSLLIEIGDGTDPDRLLTQTQIAVDGTEVIYKIEGAVSQPYDYLAADTVDAKFTIAGGGDPTLAEVTSGEIHLYLFVKEPKTKLQTIRGPLE